MSFGLIWRLYKKKIKTKKRKYNKKTVKRKYNKKNKKTKKTR
uniref:Uncharacterized protein n=1 Tax=viral metagenome TaxID=1070528 RepID=A0A6C0C437_9ZZZZ